MQVRTLPVTALLLLSLWPAPHSTAQAPVLPSAREVLAQAKAQAAAGHKHILLVFSASWCGPCHRFEGFLNDPVTGAIMRSAFAIGRLDVGENPGDKRHADSPGGMALRASLGGDLAGYPYVVMLDASGRPIINSVRPDGTREGVSIGYPDLPVEIDWFMTMLARAAPSLSPAETDTIHRWLTTHSTLH